MKQRPEQQNEVLDQETLEILGICLKPEPKLEERRVNALRANIMQQVDALETSAQPQLVTIRSDQGEWQLLMPGIYKKQLSIDESTGIESYLLRLDAGSEAPAHEHPYDELCLVLEGELQFDDIYLKQGDYHFAPKGSKHGMATTNTGAIVFLQSKIAA